MSRCALCPRVNTCIPPDGPDDADVLFIGEAPGKQEQQKGQVFIGRTGEEVNGHYLPLAGLTRYEVGFTNAIRCLPVSAGGKLDPARRADVDLLHSCAEQHLYPHIERSRPKILVPLGSFACKAICPDVNLEMQHGFPVETAWGTAFPMYHPALGLYEPKKMLLIRNDWMRLKQYLRGTLTVPVDDIEPDYAEVTDARELSDLDPSQPLAVDTESTRRRDPFCLTYSQHAGQGRLIRSERRDLLAAFQSQVHRWQAPILAHNWLYDWAVTEAMALSFPLHHVIDTMQAVFHLGNLPQGLKALAFRELGMAMEDFEDVVTPYSMPLVLDYYRLAQTVTWPKPAEDLIVDSKTGMLKLYKPQSMNTKLKRFFTDFGKNPEKDVFQMWEKNWLPQQAMIEAECGEWPGLCISHVPFEKTLYYACRDADATRRLWDVIRTMRQRVRKKPQEKWRAA